MTTVENSVEPDRNPEMFPAQHRTAAREGSFTPAALVARFVAVVRGVVWNAWVNGVAAWPIWPGRVRRHMLNLAGLDIHTNGVSAHCRFTNADVHIGRYTYVNEGFFADAHGGIWIGERCAFGPRVMVISSTHIVGSGRQRCGPHDARRVVIDDGTAVGGGAAVHAGVKLGKGVLVAAGAVVMRSIRANALVAGVPGKVVHIYDN